MARIWTLLIGFLIEAVGTLAGRVMVALGIQVVTYYGFTAAINYGVSYITSSWVALPPIALQLLGTLRVAQDLAIIMGAISARLALKGLTADSLTFWVMRGRLGT
jgi:hypothetical protein